MAFQKTTRSFSGLGTTSSSTTPVDKPDLGNGGLGPNFGGTSTPWGSSNIWASGGLSSSFASRAATRDNSQSREAAPKGQKSRTGGDIEGKTGSGSLVDSSVLDKPRSNGWPSKRSDTSASQTQTSDRAFAQQRSASNARASQVYPGATQPFSTQPLAISLTKSSPSQQRPNFTSTFGGNELASSRGLEQPPNVYTKFDRPIDPSHAREKHDSAVHWIDRSKLPSPTEERKSAFSNSYSSRNNSLAASREPSQPPSRYADYAFPGSDFTTSTQGTTPLSSRTQSISSQQNGGQAGYGAHADFLVPQFGHMSLQDGQCQPKARKALNSTRHSEQDTYTDNGVSYNKYAADGMADSMYGDGSYADDTEEIEWSNANYAPWDRWNDPNRTCFNFSYYQGGSTLARAAEFPTPANSADWRYGSSHTASPISPKACDPPSGPRSQFDWNQYQNVPPLTANKRGSVALDQHQYYDPRMPPMMAMQARNPYAMYNPYTMSNAIQINGSHMYLGPHMVPISMTGMELQRTSRDSISMEVGVQSALMYEFKNNKTNKRYELKDIYDHIAEFSGDQHGSRLIQQKLETANSDEKDHVFREIQPNAIQLMTDVFGNYVIQKFFEHGDQNQKKILANQMENKVLSLSLQMYGCRVVQKALEHILVDQQAQLIREIDGNVLRCVKDQNGNHVVQKAIERCPSPTISFVIAAFQGQVQHLSIHPYGCRVIQRCLEHCDFHSKNLIMKELHENMASLIADQYGNYVVQHVVEHGGAEDKKRVLALVFRGLESYSRHKFASNVVEKCLECAAPEWRHQVLYAFVNANQKREGEGLVGMVKDSYGNYVIQKLLDVLSGPDYLNFLQDLQQAMNTAKRTGCGKQVVAIEKKMHEFRFKLLSHPAGGDGQTGQQYRPQGQFSPPGQQQQQWSSQPQRALGPPPQPFQLQRPLQQQAGAQIGFERYGDGVARAEVGVANVNGRVPSSAVSGNGDAVEGRGGGCRG